MPKKAYQGNANKNYYENTRFSGMAATTDYLTDGTFNTIVNMDISDTGASVTPRKGYITTSLYKDNGSEVDNIADTYEDFTTISNRGRREISYCISITDGGTTHYVQGGDLNKYDTINKYISDEYKDDSNITIGIVIYTSYLRKVDAVDNPYDPYNASDFKVIPFDDSTTHTSQLRSYTDPSTNGKDLYIGIRYSGLNPDTVMGSNTICANLITTARNKEPSEYISDGYKYHVILPIIVKGMFTSYNNGQYVPKYSYTNSDKPSRRCVIHKGYGRVVKRYSNDSGYYSEPVNELNNNEGVNELLVCNTLNNGRDLAKIMDINMKSKFSFKIWFTLYNSSNKAVYSHTYDVGIDDIDKFLTLGTLKTPASINKYTIEVPIILEGYGSESVTPRAIVTLHYNNAMLYDDGYATELNYSYQSGILQVRNITIQLDNVSVNGTVIPFMSTAYNDIVIDTSDTVTERLLYLCINTDLIPSDSGLSNKLPNRLSWFSVFQYNNSGDPTHLLSLIEGDVPVLDKLHDFEDGDIVFVYDEPVEFANAHRHMFFDSMSEIVLEDCSVEVLQFLRINYVSDLYGDILNYDTDYSLIHECTLSLSMPAETSSVSTSTIFDAGMHPCLLGISIPEGYISVSNLPPLYQDTSYSSFILPKNLHYISDSFICDYDVDIPSAKPDVSSDIILDTKYIYLNNSFNNIHANIVIKNCENLYIKGSFENFSGSITFIECPYNFTTNYGAGAILPEYLVDILKTYLQNNGSDASVRLIRRTDVIVDSLYAYIDNPDYTGKSYTLYLDSDDSPLTVDNPINIRLVSNSTSHYIDSKAVKVYGLSSDGILNPITLSDSDSESEPESKHRISVDPKDFSVNLTFSEWFNYSKVYIRIEFYRLYESIKPLIVLDDTCVLYTSSDKTIMVSFKDTNHNVNSSILPENGSVIGYVIDDLDVRNASDLTTKRIRVSDAIVNIDYRDVTNYIRRYYNHADVSDFKLMQSVHLLDTMTSNYLDDNGITYGIANAYYEYTDESVHRYKFILKFSYRAYGTLKELEYSADNTLIISVLDINNQYSISDFNILSKNGLTPTSLADIQAAYTYSSVHSTANRGLYNTVDFIYAKTSDGYLINYSKYDTDITFIPKYTVVYPPTSNGNIQQIGDTLAISGKFSNDMFYSYDIISTGDSVDGSIYRSPIYALKDNKCISTDLIERGVYCDVGSPINDTLDLSDTDSLFQYVSNGDSKYLAYTYSDSSANKTFISLKARGFFINGITIVFRLISAPYKAFKAYDDALKNSATLDRRADNPYWSYMTYDGLVYASTSTTTTRQIIFTDIPNDITYMDDVSARNQVNVDNAESVDSGTCVFHTDLGDRLVIWKDCNVYLSVVNNVPNTEGFFTAEGHYVYSAPVIKVIQYKDTLLVFTSQDVYSIYPYTDVRNVTQTTVNSETGKTESKIVQEEYIAYGNLPVLYNTLCSKQYADAIQVYNQMVLFYSSDGQMFLIKPSATIDNNTRFNIQYFNRSVNDILANYNLYMYDRMIIYYDEGELRTRLTTDNLLDECGHIKKSAIHIKVYPTINNIKIFYCLEGYITYILVYDVNSNYWKVYDTSSFTYVKDITYIGNTEVMFTRHDGSVYFTIPYTENFVIDNNYDSAIYNVFKRENILCELDTGNLSINNHLVKRFRNFNTVIKNINAKDISFKLDMIVDEALIRSKTDGKLLIANINSEHRQLVYNSDRFENVSNVYEDGTVLFNVEQYTSQKLLTTNTNIVSVGKVVRFRLHLSSKGVYKLLSYGIIYKERTV